MDRLEWQALRLALAAGGSPRSSPPIEPAHRGGAGAELQIAKRFETGVYTWALVAWKCA
jgi:hypothetical protein